MKCLPYLTGLLFAACMSKSAHTYENAAYIGKTDLSINAITLDSIKLERISTSFLGTTHIYGDAIYYIDEKFCYIYKFDAQGKKLSRFAGVGSAKNELPLKTIQFSAFTPDGNLVVIGPSWDCFIFDQHFNRTNDYAVNWHFNASKEELLKQPDPANMRMYSFAYGLGKIKANNDRLFFPILSQHPAFNPITASYPAQARVIGKMRLKNGYVEDIMGSFPPAYKRNRGKLAFPYPLFDLKEEGTLYVTFPADSLIYITDEDYAVQAAFGSQGQHLDTNYANAKELKSIVPNMIVQNRDRGFYTNLTFIKQKDLLFRSYQKNAQTQQDGLQIYRHQTLIGDVPVPKGFEVNGYIHPWFYSKAYINDESGDITLYKFKID